MRTVPLAIATGMVLVLAASPALARCGSDSYLERRLKSYGFDVDPASLSDVQMAQVCAALSSGENARDTMYKLSGALKAK